MYDSHMDTPSQLLRLRDPGLDNAYAQVDFPKLRRGGVDGAFFALYTPAEMAPDAATRYALQMLSATYDAVEAHPGGRFLLPSLRRRQYSRLHSR